MKAIGFKSSFQLDEGNCFEEFNFDIPHPSGHELLVKVQSISVNPVDTKRRPLLETLTLDLLSFQSHQQHQSQVHVALCQLALYAVLYQQDSH